MAEQYGDDYEGFLTALATQYFRVTTEAIRDVDPNHLILGSRASSLSMPPQVPAAATPYLDVFSVNFYATTEGLFDALNKSWGPLVPIEGWLEAYYELSDLPLMATEFSFRSSESDPPNSYPPIYLTFDTQLERAAAYDEYVQKCFDAPETSFALNDDFSLDPEKVSDTNAVVVHPSGVVFTGGHAIDADDWQWGVVRMGTTEGFALSDEFTREDSGEFRSVVSSLLVEEDGDVWVAYMSRPKTSWSPKWTTLKKLACVR